jgi:hypothetical protein
MTKLHDFHSGGTYRQPVRTTSRNGVQIFSFATKDGETMSEQPDVAALEATSAQMINVLIVIDTEALKAKFPKQDNPSPATPKRLVWEDMTNHLFMIVTGADDVQGQGTAKLVFSASAGDFVSFAGTSVYANADDAVILYGIEYTSGTTYHLFNPFVTNIVVVSGAAMPDPGGVPGTTPINGMPAIQAPANFASVGAVASREGKEYYYVDFALYTRHKGKQDLYGYYAWTWEAMINIV